MKIRKSLNNENKNLLRDLLPGDVFTCDEGVLYLVVEPCDDDGDMEVFDLENSVKEVFDGCSRCVKVDAELVIREEE
jgi:hypothetical protein